MNYALANCFGNCCIALWSLMAQSVISLPCSKRSLSGVKRTSPDARAFGTVYLIRDPFRSVASEAAPPKANGPLPVSTPEAPRRPVGLGARSVRFVAADDCSNTYGYELLNAGELESFLDGKARKITVASIQAYIARKLAAGAIRTARQVAPPHKRSRPRKALLAPEATP
jgi:hypothetical protein